MIMTKQQKEFPIVTLCNFRLVNEEGRRTISSPLQSCVHVGVRQADDVWGWGVPSFADTDTLFDPSSGFTTVDGTLTIEVGIVIDVIQTMCLRWLTCNYERLLSDDVKLISGLSPTEMTSLLQLDELGGTGEVVALNVVAYWCEVSPNAVVYFGTRQRGIRVYVGPR
jgi:hypothetical protein